MKKIYAYLSVFIFITSCATYSTKYVDDKYAVDVDSSKEVSHTFYLIGDAGLSPIGGMNPALKIFKNKLDKADKNSTAIFLGDNIYPAGLPDPKDSTQAYIEAKNHLDAQIKTLENFKGRPLFIPGNHDWYTEGLIGLEREENYIKRALKEKEKDPFLPENGCPIDVIEIGEDVAIITIDTEWYLTNWDKRPDINDKCEIKSRDKFFLELEDAIKDYRDRTTVIAMHHPSNSYGEHGGHYSLRKQFYPKKMAVPVPVLGTFINVLRTTSGASIEDNNNKRYRELMKRVTTLAQYSDRVIFASGHEHTLQYILENNTPQIVSGSGAKEGFTKLLNGSQFSTGKMGYATLEVYKDGSSRVRFYGVGENNNEEFLFTNEVLPPTQVTFEAELTVSFPDSVEASVYTDNEIEKSRFYKGIWGERYRKYYGTKVKVPTVRLDSLMGGLEPVKKGGGHQSKSLRLRAKDGREYVMRALKKSAELYLQSMAFQDQYVLDDLKETYTQELLQDFYTGSHPYAPFTTARLSDAVGIYHTNPVLYYVPKQPALKEYNDSFGDELYMIEEHTGDGHGDLASFGYSNDLKSTDGMLEDLRDDEKYEVDKDLYLRARLFDMVLGDWDRHVDQWRWAEFKDEKKDKVVYRPVPRDRDQVYSKMGDGALMNIATRIIPGLRLMEGFNEEIRSVKGFNSSPMTYVLDLTLLGETEKSQWLAQAKYLQENLKENDIDEAFKAFPEEVRDETVNEIKQTLLARLSHIQETANEYYKILNKYAVVAGTDKDDWFEINRLNDTETEVKVFRNIGDKKKRLFYYKIFSSDDTKELWVFGLDDDDIFEVKNPSNFTGVKVRIIGGHNNDIYRVDNGKNVALYDFKSKKNTFEKTSGAKVKLSDDYELNTYQPLKLRNSFNQIIPTIGFNPDDGVRIGFLNTYTYNGFRQNPFTQQHTIGASYYFATSGFDVKYQGEFAHVFENWNAELKARFTSPNFAVNFFGFGNDTENFDDDLGLDFNRVKLRQIDFSPSLVWRGQLGAKVKLGLSYENISVEETNDRFINTFYQQNGEETNSDFVGAHATYTYENRDNEAFPTLGMGTSLEAGYKENLSKEGGSFGYIIPSLSFDYKIIPSGRLVLATKWKAHFNLGDEYEFYQAASIGGIDGLRGFRNQRFTGKTSYYQNTDIRFSLAKKRTRLLPTAMGLFGGFDYGRVWMPEMSSGRWHTSYGGGFFLNASDIISVNTAIFASEDGPRFTFGLGFGF
ncbi:MULTISPECIES: metallophosphoesterase [unclassified Maribacter]|uniref:metallophosphoesterase n=1 Tax=unclassified Maribacter TaxID=2615042 RepID=UPI0025801AD7|nr:MULTISPECIES: metallophosphoesterase [unclassified Maribacter]|tara:strand:- start:37398 stop:41120 length:3723 start_codon:yes stop_codon:yes gene_type:complete